MVAVEEAAHPRVVQTPVAAPGPPPLGETVRQVVGDHGVVLVVAKKPPIVHLNGRVGENLQVPIQATDRRPDNLQGRVPVATGPPLGPPPLRRLLRVERLAERVAVEATVVPKGMSAHDPVALKPQPPVRLVEAVVVRHLQGIVLGPATFSIKVSVRCHSNACAVARPPALLFPRCQN